MKKMIKFRDDMKHRYKYMEGRVLVPIVLWLLGVPGSIVIVLWFFFFRD